MRLRSLFSVPGLVVGAIFFALSLTPSLIPRDDVMQGIVSGVSLTAGYALGILLTWLWLYLGLPAPRERTRRVLAWCCATACLVLVIGFLWQATGWQNSVRAAMGLGPVAGVRPFTIALIAAAVFLVLLAVARGFRFTMGLVSGRLARRIPPRISLLLGLVTAFVVFWALVSDVLLSAGLRAVDSVYQQLDARMEADLPAPDDPDKPGGASSLLRWQDMGHQGRRYLALGISGRWQVRAWSQSGSTWD